MSKEREAVEHDRAIKEVLTHIFEILLCAGKNEEQVRAYANACIETAGAGFGLMTANLDGTDSSDFGAILRTWHREGEFLSPAGYPRPLPFAGANGLRKLIERFFPPARVKGVFAELQNAGLIQKTTNSRWLPTRKDAVFPHLNRELLMHLSEGVSRLIETVVRNVNAEQSEEVLFERSTKVRRFPVSSAREFRSFVKNQAMSFLGAVDDWLESQVETAGRKTGRKCTAGVYTFAFMDDMRNYKPRSPPSTAGHRRGKRLRQIEAAHPSTPVAKSSRRSSSATHS